jgi:hypothetical protein
MTRRVGLLFVPWLLAAHHPPAAAVRGGPVEVHLEYSDLGSDATSFCCGSHHTCALRSEQSPALPGGAGSGGDGDKQLADDGYVLCWGRDYLQQTDPPDDERFVQVACGGTFTCGLTFDEQVRCWGGIGGAGVAGRFVQLSAGLDHACAVSLAGVVACMGRNSRGEATPPDSAAVLGDGERFVQVSAGKAHSCALTNIGGVVCWGSNDKDQCNAPPRPRSGGGAGVGGGGGGGSDRGDGAGDDEDESSGDDGGGGAVALRQVVASLGKHTCALEHATGFARCWGGKGDRDGAATPPAGVAFSALAAGRKFTCGIRADGGGANSTAAAAAAASAAGTIECWGKIPKPPRTANGEPFVQLSAGEDHACASTARGELRCWGTGSYSKTATPDQLTVLG